MIDSATLVDAAIALTLLEAAVLLVWRRRTGRGLAARQLLPNLGAGLLLMLALRGVLAGATWPWLAACLLLAGCAHAGDLWARRHETASSVATSDSGG